MPRPRFEKLSADKKERILEAAAKEFAAYGFEGASINRILEQAEISKGAAYYYFDDKIDLYLTAVQYYGKQMLDATLEDLTVITAETFWEMVLQVYRNQYLRVFERPWLFGALKAVLKLSASSQQDARLQALFDEMKGLALTLFKQGQVLGVIRTDLPDDLMVALMWGIDESYDNWLLEHWSEFEPTEVELLSQRMVNSLKRMFAPE